MAVSMTRVCVTSSVKAFLGALDVVNNRTASNSNEDCVFTAIVSSLFSSGSGSTTHIESEYVERQ